MRRILLLPILALLLAAVPLMAQSPAATNCSLPAGAFAGSVDDPQVPVYCLPSAPLGPTTRVSGANDWVDTFGSSSRLNDGDLGYRTFESIGGIGQTRHLVVGDHWIDDNEQQYGGGALLRPNRTFTFENSKMVVEADFAAGKDVYAGNAWGEFVITPAVQPDINPPYAPEQEYAYGRFHGFPAFGCRIQSGDFVCAGFNGTGVPFPPTADRAPCYSLDDGGVADPQHYGIRLWELSFFQHCGDNFPGGVHYDIADGTNRSVFRECPVGSDYDPCLDRFRLELTASSMVWYVNGIRMFEDSGWDTLHQLTNLLNAGPVYVYFADWDFQQPTGSTIASMRFHWGRLAINPHNPDGTFMAPSASPSFGQPVATPVVPSPLPTQTATTAPTATPSPIMTPTPSPTATAPATSTLTPIATVVVVPPTVVVPITCQVNVRINGVEGGWKPC